MLSPEEREELQNVCDHVGYHSAVSQNVVVGITQILVIAGHCCAKCGKVFTHITPVDNDIAPKEPESVIKPPPIQLN